MRPFNVIIIVVASLFFSSCQYDPYADDLTTKKPKSEDFLGIYQFKEQTISSNAVIDESGKKGYIYLKADGTYEAHNIPNVFGGADAKNRKLILATGKWELDEVGGVGDGSGSSKPNWGVRLTGIDENLSTIEFMNNEPPYRLIVTYDDPDLGAVMIFTKK